MDIPAFLSTGSVHLSLREGQTSPEVIPLVNQFYGTTLDEADFKVSQVVVDGDGRYSMDLIPKDSDTVAIHLVNQTMTPLATETVTPAAVQTFAFLADPVHLADVVEMAFLDEIPVGWTAPTGYPTELPYQLAQLLTQYQVLGAWHSGTLSRQTTGGFTLVYKGDSKGLPEGYSVPASEQVAIIRINSGKVLGELCLYS